jgi:hypothetical protein
VCLLRRLEMRYCINCEGDSDDIGKTAVKDIVQRVQRDEFDTRALYCVFLRSVYVDLNA